MDEIVLDIVPQIYCFAEGLKPYIVIDDATGEIIEHEDLAATWMAELKKVMKERPAPPAPVVDRKAKTRVTRVIPL